MKKQAQFLNSGNAEGREYLATESVDLSLALCGYEVCDPGVNYPPRAHSHYTLIAIRQGRGSCTVGAAQYDMEAQDVLLVFPGTEYAFAADPQVGCSCMGIGFTGIRAEECMLHAGFSREEPCRKSLCLRQMEAVLAQALVPQVGFSDLLRANGYLLIFLGALVEENAKAAPMEQPQKTQGAKSAEYVRNAMEYISRHYPEDVKIKELADFVGINRSYLASSFKKATGYSPKEYLLHLRMERAKQLLKSTQRPISSVSSAVGYEDPLAFSRIFKRYTGFSPTNYREQQDDSPERPIP